MLRRFHITDADHRRKEEFKKSHGLLPISGAGATEVGYGYDMRSIFLGQLRWLPLILFAHGEPTGNPVGCSPCWSPGSFYGLVPIAPRPVSLLPTSLTALGDPMDCHPKKVLVSKKSISCLFLGFPLPPAFPFMVAAANEIGSTPCSFLK